MLDIDDIYFPEEFVIIGTALKLRKTRVTINEIKEYTKNWKFNIEYDNEPYRFCKDTDGGYIVSIPNIHPAILQVLTNI